MHSYFEKLKTYIEAHPPNYGDGESVLTILYECHNESNPYDNEQIKADFNELYRLMNGMELREMDRIIYPVCKFCRDHERSGFIEGIKIGIRKGFNYYMSIVRWCGAVIWPTVWRHGRNRYS